MTGPKPRARREHRLHSGPGVRRVPLHVERQGSHTSIPAPHINKPPWPQAVHARAHGTSTSGTSSLGLPDSVSSWPYHRSTIQGGAYSSGCLPTQQPQSPRWLGAHPPQRGQERTQDWDSLRRRIAEVGCDEMAELDNLVMLTLCFTFPSRSPTSIMLSPKRCTLQKFLNYKCHTTPKREFLDSVNYKS